MIPIVISIQDEEPGIPEKLKQQLFDRFTQDKSEYRASLDTNPDIQTIENDASTGTGLGLALCKSLVQLHSGEIWLDESYKKGARFFSLQIKL